MLEYFLETDQKLCREGAILNSDTVLVTGGAGFLGSHVTDKLIAMGYVVTVVDNLHTGKSTNLPDGVDFYNADIAGGELEDVFVAVKPKVVIHLAAQISVQSSMQNPLLDANINIQGSLQILEYCIKYGVQKLVYASSGGAIYGEPKYLPCDEMHPVNPLSNYGVSKFAVENYLYTHNLTNGLDYTTLRFGNIYGPRQDPFGEAGVIAIFALAMLEGRTVIINGNGEQERDFIYVTDAADAVIKGISGKIGNSYNIGVGKGHSINYISSLLKTETGYEEDLEYGSAKPGEVFKIYLDSSKALRELDWAPQMTIENGIKETVNWFKSSIS
jgi:UDP-glucose 4-epimerase